MHPSQTTWGRRQFLAGAGALLALPLLESALPRRARAAATKASATPPQRLVTVHLPCGLINDAWVPTATGSTFTLPSSLAPLGTLQKNALIFSNMQNDSAFNSPYKSGQGLHALGLGTLFTGAKLQLDVGRPLASTSMDQIFAQSAVVKGQTSLSTLNLGLQVAIGDCDNDYACQDMQSISWSDANTPIVDQEDPQQVFDTNFANIKSSQSAAQLAYQRSLRKSVLDGVLDQATSLQSKLNAADSNKLDQYFTSVRALELQFGNTNAATCQPGTRPGSKKTTTLLVQAQAMMDLMAMAFLCDLTRSVSFNFGAGHSNHYYNFLPGINDTHHSLSHHNGDASKIAQLRTINQWHISMLTRFWNGLAAIPEGDSTALDNSVTLATSELADGNAHNYTNLSVLVMGGGSFMTTGRHVKAGSSSGYGNLTELQLAILQGLGTGVTSFGDFKTTKAMSLTA